MILFNNLLNIFFSILLLNGVGHMIKDHSDSERGNTLLPFNGLFFRLAPGGFLYAPRTDNDNTYQGFWYTTYETLAGMTNSSVGPPRGMDSMARRSMSYHGPRLARHI